MKRIKLRPGLHFEIPGVDASGLITGFEGPTPISYFFPFAYGCIEETEVRPENAILIAVHNIRMFLDEPVKHSVLKSFNASDWPRPVYVSSTQAGSPNCFADTIQVLDGVWDAPLGLPWDPDKRPLGFTADHSAIPLSIVKVFLGRILDTGDVNAGRYYPVKGAQPNGGMLLQNYMRQKSNR